MNILYLTNELNYADGVSTNLFYLLSGIKKNYPISIFLACGGGDAVSKFENAGINVTVFKNLNHSYRSIKNFSSSVLFIYRLSKKNKINIIHSHNHYAANIAHRSSKFIKLQTVQTIHGIIPEAGRLKHIISGNLITVNRHVYEYVKQKADPKTNLHLIYNGIDFRNDFEKKSNVKMKFIAASRFEKGKGIDIFIKAVAGLPESYKSRAEFYIAGEGSLENEFRQLNMNLDSGITFLRKILDLRNTLRETDVFIITSSGEGFPMTILEAAAEKNLIITSDFNGIENIVTDNEHKLTFQIGNTDELKEKIIFAIDNPDIVKNVSDNFFTEAGSKFDAHIMCKQHLDLYKSIC